MIKNTARTGMLVALALVLGYFESLLPINIGIPGVKLGLANTVVLYAVCLVDAPYAFALVLVKVILSCFMYAGASAMIYSLFGGIFSFVVMYALKKKTAIGITALSVAGAAAHNGGQIAAACIVLQSVSIVSYLPVLLVTGVATGVVTGIIATLIIERLKEIQKEGTLIKRTTKGMAPVLSTVFLFACITLAACAVCKKKDSEKYEFPSVIVIRDSEEIYNLPLNEYGTYTIYSEKDGSEEAAFIIDEEGVRMEYSSCKDKTCVRTGTIKAGDNPIICLPNRLLLKIVGGSRNVKEYSAESFDFFDTSTIIVGYDTSEEEFNRIKTEVFELLRKLDEQFDIYEACKDGSSNLYTLNRLSLENEEKGNAGYVECDLPEDTLKLLEFGKEVMSLTGGKSDITLGRMLSVWHDAREIATEHPDKAYIPDIDTLKRMALLSGYDKLEIDVEKGVARIAAGCTVDVGAIAKGYALNIIRDYLIAEGKTGYMINCGGNVCAVGSKPNGEGWKVGLENPLFNDASVTNEIKNEKYIDTVNLNGMSVATSGSYQRYYEINGERYHHIIDPDTLMPENRWISVSVMSDDAGLGDALSTALFNMSIEDGMALISSIKNAEAMWMAPDGKVKYSEGFK